jgi:hypothetical protein
VLARLSYEEDAASNEREHEDEITKTYNSSLTHEPILNINILVAGRKRNENVTM